ncbi:helix-turn-helix domain-containing protein [Halorarius halobius]|uniref:helix-turn-helix domain-containing protein n=1 Tax=Halorarius halobius TaxID=2962671 RepID=UPI0020CCB889|nr:helix-turn-helix domain-containing protein [Halorarius halobius]
MRYFDFTLSPSDGAIHPVDQVILNATGVEREALMHVNALGDGTGVLLYELHGSPVGVVEELAEHPEVIDLDLLDAEEHPEVVDPETLNDDEDTFHLYLHVRPGEPAGSLMSLAQKYALMIDTPLEFSGRGSLRVTVVGTHEMLRKALDELPDDVRINVEQVGQYSPENGHALAALTDRQLEVFQAAVELGYYEIPRRATHEDIADRLDCAPSTVDEHLRKAESQVLSSLVGN